MSTRDCWRDYWSKIHASRRGTIEDNRVVISHWGNKIHVVCKFDSSFVAGAKEIGGRWKRKSKVWSFPGPSKSLVVLLATSVYGKNSVCVVEPKK